MILMIVEMDIRTFVLVLCGLHVAWCSGSGQNNIIQKEDNLPPFLKVILCPMQEDPWECLRQQTVRALESISRAYELKWDEFKVDASKELLSHYQARGFSITERVREKTSSLFDKIENGVSEIKNFASSTANRLLGREEEDEDEEDVEYEIEDDLDIDLEDEKNEKSGTGNKNKRKRKKKPHESVAATLDGDDELDEVELAADLLGGLGGHGGGHGIKLPHKYGRSLGVSRKKKKKNKKALMKLVLAASFVKAKIDLLCKLLSTHLQIKFLAIALIGLLLNLARFWMDIKQGHGPQKVIYYEHAHHQHHYDEGDDYEHGGGGGGYWRRSNLAANENGKAEGLDEESHYSRVTDEYPTASASSSYLRELPNRMAYLRQLPQGVRMQ